MKKRIVGIVGTLLLSSGLYAKDNIYVGVEYGVVNYSYTNYSGQSTYNTLKLGKYFGSHRISLDVDSGRKIGFNYDYMFDTQIYGSYPYIGTGLFYQEEQYADVTSKGFFIPFTLALEYDLDKDFTMDFGLRFVADSYKYTNGNNVNESHGQINYFVSILYNF